MNPIVSCSRTALLRAALVAVGLLATACPESKVEPPVPGALDASKSLVFVTREGGVVADGADFSIIEVHALDSAGTPIPKVDVTLAATGTGNTLTQPTAQTNAYGVATGRITSSVVETKTITATAGGVELATKPTVAFVAVPKPAVSLAFKTQPANADKDAALAPVEVQFLDADGHLTRKGNSDVTVTLGNARGATLGGTTTMTPAQGVAVFNTLTVDQGGIGYTLIASAGTLPDATSTPFDIAGGAAPTLELALPSTGASGAAVNAVVTLKDSAGAVDATYVGTVRFTTSDTAAQAGLPGDYTFVSGDAGVHTFPITFLTVGAQTLTATDTVTAALTATANITVGPGAATKIMVSGYPSPTTAGVAHDVTLTAMDAANNTATGYTGTVHLTSTDAQATLPADYTFVAGDNGVHALAVTLKSAGSQGITATDTTTASINGSQTGITVQAAAAGALAFVQQPTNVGRSSPITPAVTVGIRDAFGNPVAAATDTVVMALANNPSGATLSGTLSQAAAAGIATFNDLAISLGGTGFTLSATSGTLTAATSAAFDVSGCPTGYTGPTCADCATGYHHPTAAPTTCVDACTESNPCTSPTPPSCTGNTLTTYGTPGNCTAEFTAAPYYTCAYTPSTQDCTTTAGNICFVDACIADPCVGQTCTTPVASCAADGITLTTYAASTCRATGVGTHACDDHPSTTDCSTSSQVCSGAACITAAAPGAGDLLITEVMHNPTGAQNQKKWFEIKSLATGALNLAGISLGDGTNTFTLPATPPVVLPAGGLFVFGGSTDTGLNGGAAVNYAWTGTFDFGATGALSLRAGATVLESFTWTASFPQTLGSAMNLSSRVFAKGANARSWFWCNASAAMTGGDNGTPGADNNDCAIPATAAGVDYCITQSPATIPALPVLTDATVYGQVADTGSTKTNQAGNDYFPGLTGELGYGTTADASTWTWGPAAFNPAYTTTGDNDEMMAALNIAATGTYSYGYRFTINAATTYCDLAGPLAASTSANWGSATVVWGAKGTSAQIAAIRAATPGTISLPITQGTVTYVWNPPAQGTDPVGFAIQAEQNGPAIMVAVDPSTLTPAPVVGDQVSFTATTTALVGGQLRITALDVPGWSRTAQGVAIAPLVQDLSAVTPLSPPDPYDVELIRLTGTVASAFASASAPFVSASITTAGYPATDANLKLRIPGTLQTGYNIVQGCTFTVNATPMWRFNAQAQPSAWARADFSALSCPAPKVTTAAPTSGTTVVVNFDRNIDPASVLAAGTQFVITGGTGLAVSAASASGTQVTLTTALQDSATTYTVTVAGTVTDTVGTGLDGTANSATFPGFVTIASVLINEVNQAITGSSDLIELLVTSPGTLNGLVVQQDVTVAPIVFVTLPSVTVATGDIVVIHMNPTAGWTNETTKSSCADASCFGNAWDFRGGTTGITNSSRVIAVKNPDGTLQAAVPFTNNGTPPTNFGPDVVAIQAAGLWLPADCSGAACTSTTAETISAVWTGTGTTVAGLSVRRAPGANTKTAADWAVGASSWGAVNP